MCSVSVHVKPCGYDDASIQEILGMGPCQGDLYVYRDGHMLYPCAIVISLYGCLHLTHCFVRL